MVPYAAYLRVYEPLESVSGTGRRSGAGAPAPDSRSDHSPDQGADPGAAPPAHELTTAEQHRSRRAAVGTGTIPLGVADSGTTFVISRNGRSFAAPADELVRSWAALARLATTLSPSAARALTPGAVLADAGEALRAWRQQHPDGAPHVREATWRLPIAWLLVAAPDEREDYQADAVATARYLTPMVQARRRIARAHAVARRTFPESDEVAELVDLGRWLEAFHAHSWVELDLAGLGEPIRAADPNEPDRSLRSAQEAVEHLRDGSVDEAVEIYREVSTFWGSLALREHAN